MLCRIGYKRIRTRIVKVYLSFSLNPPKTSSGIRTRIVKVYQFIKAMLVIGKKSIRTRIVKVYHKFTTVDRL